MWRLGRLVVMWKAPGPLYRGSLAMWMGRSWGYLLFPFHLESRALIGQDIERVRERGPMPMEPPF